MRPLPCAPPPPLPPHLRANRIPSRKSKPQPCAVPFPDALRAAAAAAAISLSLLSCDAVGALAVAERPPVLCRDGGAVTKEEARTEVVTNEQLVEEAWEVVNEGFLPDAGSRPWSPETWMEKKQDILQSSIRSRSRAHDIIQKMLTNLGDPYTRFLPPSELIYTTGRDCQVQNTIVAERGPLVTTPLMVLVNNRTASASEIVASALHDNCKSVLVGEKSFGKGLIQSVFELHDGSGIVVTVGKYVTPNHKDINGNGIEPDYRRLPDFNEANEYLSHCRSKKLS